MKRASVFSLQFLVTLSRSPISHLPSPVSRLFISYLKTVLFIFCFSLPKITLGVDLPQGQELPDSEKQALYKSLLTFDWLWLLMFTSSAVLVFAVILFGALHFRRWGVPRLGWFLITMVVLANRVLQPEELFWNAFGCFMGIISVISGFYLFHRREYVAGKEPIYFFLNGFSLLIVSFTASNSLFAISAMSLIASLFFITTKNPRKPGRHGQAHPFELETLRKKIEK